MRNGFMLSFKCFLCGFSMCFPGLSGGSTAVLLGVYKTMTDCVSGLLTDFKNNVFKLLNIAVSALSGFLIFAVLPGKYASENIRAFKVFGLSAITISCIAFLIRSIKKHTGSGTRIIVCSILSGALSLALIQLLLLSIRLDLNTRNAIILFVCGILLSLALILPGISFSYMLLFIGIYDKVMTAAASLDMAFLAPLAAGCGIGILTFSHMISAIMEKYSAICDFFLLGFTAASAVFIMI